MAATRLRPKTTLFGMRFAYTEGLQFCLNDGGLKMEWIPTHQHMTDEEICEALKTKKIRVEMGNENETNVIHLDPVPPPVPSEMNAEPPISDIAPPEESAYKTVSLATLVRQMPADKRTILPATSLSPQNPDSDIAKYMTPWQKWRSGFDNVCDHVGLATQRTWKFTRNTSAQALHLTVIGLATLWHASGPAAKSVLRTSHLAFTWLVANTIRGTAFCLKGTSGGILKLRTLLQRGLSSIRERRNALRDTSTKTLLGHPGGSDAAQQLTSTEETKVNPHAQSTMFGMPSSQQSKNN